MDDNEEVVMTACKKYDGRGEHCTVRIERLHQHKVDYSGALHVAEGPFRGIIVNKAVSELEPVTESPNVKMELIASLRNKKRSGAGPRESRVIKFWFKPTVKRNTFRANANKYFRQLLQPDTFPRDYTQFIKKAVVLAQNFPSVRRIELILAPTGLDRDVPDAVEPPKVTQEPVQTAAPPAPPDESDDDEDLIQNFITVLTPAVYDYQYLPEVPVTNKTSLAFRVKAAGDAHLALSSIYGDTYRKTYEIVIGANGNTKTLIRYGGQGKVMESANTRNVISPEELRNFWLSWDNNSIQVGEGMRRGCNTCVSWSIPPGKLHTINCLAVSTAPCSEGEWEFIEFLAPPKTDEDDKQARRARIRNSLMWIAKKQKMLQVLEDAYPDSLDTAELLQGSNVKLRDMMKAVVFLKDLQKRNLITEVNKGIWMRAPGGLNDTSHEVKIVQRLPESIGDWPTVAIVTTLYCEKLAVDAMIERKLTYIEQRKDRGGEAQVYTLGSIGGQQVVSTKLRRAPKVTAEINSSNCSAINKLLGVFGGVEQVLLVGVAGGIPHFTDYHRHVRLGDVVVATPSQQGALYVHCESMQRTPRGTHQFDYVTRSWAPRDPRSDVIQAAVTQLRQLERGSYFSRPWEKFVEQGLETLRAEESTFHRPPAKTDRLYAQVEGRRVQVEPPAPPRGEEDTFTARVRYGAVGAGRQVALSEVHRQEFGAIYGVLAFDQGVHAVLDALEGARGVSYGLVRGVSDYEQGETLKQWQPYAALAAAAYTKALVTSLPRGGGHRPPRH